MEFLQQLAEWVDSTSGSYRPEIAWPVRIVLAIIVFGIGAFLAQLISGVIGAGINRIPFVRRANEDAVSADATIGAGIGKALFYLLLLIVLAVALSIVGLTQVVAPVQNMWDDMLAFLPELVGAAALIIFGLILAGIVKRLVQSVLDAAGLDRLVSPIQDEEATGLSNAIAWIVYVVIAVPAVIAGIDVLGIEAISTPTTLMLNEIMDALPNVVIAGVVLAISFFIARFVSKLIEQVLPQFGIDAYVQKLGILEPKTEKGLTATKAIAGIVGIAIMLFGAVEATRLLNFQILSDFVGIVIAQGGQILFGTLIIVLGFVFANVIGKILDATGTGFSDELARYVKYAVMVLATILGVSRMGLDPMDGMFILNIAQYFALALAVAIGVGGALAFGLGGREWAGRKLEEWSSKPKKPAATAKAAASTTAKTTGAKTTGSTTTRKTTPRSRTTKKTSE
ncbi:MAG: hypothetical protein CMK09_08330 [Ponticaulis sp.]|nr:hypothetical protein [Ponticaulis sp.]|tara:strand:+ start:21628 stop:22986 length:1359 start_codon:yes stop_codon:yes gene_type:complete